MDLIGGIRRAYFEQRWPIKEIVRRLAVSRATVRRVIRSQKTEFKYERGVQPVPKLGDWVAVLGEMLEKEARLVNAGEKTIGGPEQNYIMVAAISPRRLRLVPVVHRGDLRGAEWRSRGRRSGARGVPVDPPVQTARVAGSGQSLPKPRGGTIACKSLRSSWQIMRNASPVALS